MIIKGTKFEIWFYNYSCSVTLPASRKRLEQVADKVSIVSAETRSEALHVGSIQNPALPCRYIYAWSIEDMNRFAKVIRKIPEADHKRLSEILTEQPRMSLEDTLQILAEWWPDLKLCHMCVSA